MLIIVLIVLCFLFSFIVKDMLWKQEEYEENRQAKPVNYTIPAPPLPEPVLKPKPDIYKDVEFVNKNCKNLEDFIINDDINEFDLFKLAELNGIELSIQPGWYPLTLKLIKELGAGGWNKKVSCIKEKWATLRFYARYSDYEIFERYERLSEQVCETCGEKGEVRSDTSWIYVACRKHYLEGHSKVDFASESGFIYNNVSYNWEDVLFIYFLKKTEEGDYRNIEIVFNKAVNNYGGTLSYKLYISPYAFGFGTLMAQIPSGIQGVDYRFTTQFRQVAFCEICGFKAVYRGQCECCENYTYTTQKERWNYTSESREEYISFRQVLWTIDQGEQYAKEQGLYEKTPFHKILYTEEDLKQFDE